MTTETQRHTPGPWRSKNWSDHEAQIIARVGNKDTFVSGYCLPDDARLIAAAPEMLRCLEECVAVLEPLAKYPEVNPWIIDAKGVIARAKGQNHDK